MLHRLVTPLTLSLLGCPFTLGFHCFQQQHRLHQSTSLFYKVLGVPEEGASKPSVIEEGSNKIVTGSLSNNHVSEFFRKTREGRFGSSSEDDEGEDEYGSSSQQQSQYEQSNQFSVSDPVPQQYSTQTTSVQETLPVEITSPMHVETMRHWNGYVLELDTQRFEQDGRTINIAGTPWEGSTVLADYMSNPGTGMAWEDTSVIELGCGIGTCAITAALLGANVVATDGSPAALQLTQQNSAKYQEFCKHPVQVAPLVWGDINQAYEICAGQYPNFILASDVGYYGSDRDNLKATLEAICGPETWIFMAHTWRDNTVDVDQTFYDSFLDQFERFDVDATMMPPEFQNLRPDGRTPVSIFLFRRR